MRVIVVGGGVIGLLTSMECVRAGARVDIVDQFDLPSPRATSNDHHRVVRALHRGDPRLTRAAAAAQQGWLAIERRLGTRLYHRVGALTAMPVADLPAELALFTGTGADARSVSAAELSAQYPRLRFPAGLAAIFEPAAGAVLADRMLAALTGWLRDAPGARLWPGRRVVQVGEGGEVHFDDGGVLAGDRVVVAAGPWSRELLPAALSAQLVLHRQSVLSYAPSPSRRVWADMPVIPAIGTGNGAWLMPPVADTPVRLSAASACRVVPELTDRATPDHWREHLIDQFRTLLVDFDPAAVVGATDGYYLANRAGGGPLLASFGDPPVWAYAACGGMSFKLAPLVAQVVADRTLGRPPRQTGLDSIDQPREFTPTGRSRRGGPR